MTDKKKVIGLLCTIRDNCNVTIQTLLNRKDLTFETLPEIDLFTFQELLNAEDVTRDIMYQVDPSTK